MKNVQPLLDNKICLVTGASKGIGKAIAERFSAEGGVVFACAREPGSMDKWASECTELNNAPVNPLYFDVTDFNMVKSAILKIKKEKGSIDVLVNNAGVVSYEMMSMIDFAKLRRMFEVNVISLIYIMQLISRIMMRQKRGSIINISSIVGEKGVKGQVGYSATKGAVIAATRSAAKELAEYNIRVNAIAPGMIATERLKEVLENKFRDRIENIGMGRLGEPAEVAGVSLFLASELSTYVSGQILDVDGSMIL